MNCNNGFGRIRLTTVYVVSVLLITVFFTACSGIQSNSTKNQQEIIVAIASTLSGDLASNGKDMANGIKLALDEALDASVFNKTSVKVVLFDDQGDPKTAVSVAQRICNDPRIRIVVGHLTSGSTNAAAPVYAKAGMPVIMPVPTNPQITMQGYTNLFRVPPRDNDQAPFLADYVLKFHQNARVAVVNDLTSYGQGFADEFRNAFETGNGNIVAFEGASKEKSDFRTLITKLINLKPKYVVLAATYDMGAPFARQMREQGLEATILSGDGCYGSAYLDQAGTAAEGTIVSFIAPGRESSPEAEQFFTKYESKYGKVVSFAPLGYDAGLVAIEALKQTDNPTRDNLVSTIRSNDFQVHGITGNISFDDKGDNKNKNLVLYIVKEGDFMPYMKQ